MRLPGWVNDALRHKKVRVERYGRKTRGRPSKEENRWYFCGWYWHRENRGYVVEGPFGPFPCPSAAAAHALKHYGLDYLDRPGTNARA